MRPGFPIYNQADICIGNAELFCDLLNCELPSGVRNSDFLYQFNGELCLRQGRSICVFATVSLGAFWLGHGFLNGPVVVEPASEHEVINSMLVCHFKHGERFSFIGQLVGTPAIVCLLTWCRPSAICFTVVSIVVDPVQRVSGGWLIAHVLHEALEPTYAVLPLLPSFANFYPPASPILVFWEVWVPASSEHRGPLSVCWMLPQSWLVKCGELNYVISVLNSHGVYMGLGSSEGHSATTDGLCAFMVAELTHGSRRICPWS